MLLFVATREPLAPSPLAAGAADLTRHELRCTVQGRIPRSSFFRAQMIEIESEGERESKHFFFFYLHQVPRCIYVRESYRAVRVCGPRCPLRIFKMLTSLLVVDQRVLCFPPRLARGVTRRSGNLPCSPEATQVVDCLCLCMHKELRLVEYAVAWRNNPGSAHESPASSAIAGP